MNQPNYMLDNSGKHEGNYVFQLVSYIDLRKITVSSSPHTDLKFSFAAICYTLCHDLFVACLKPDSQNFTSHPGVRVFFSSFVMELAFHMPRECTCFNPKAQSFCNLNEVPERNYKIINKVSLSEWILSRKQIKSVLHFCR